MISCVSSPENTQKHQKPNIPNNLPSTNCWKVFYTNHTPKQFGPLLHSFPVFLSFPAWPCPFLPKTSAMETQRWKRDWWSGIDVHQLPKLPPAEMQQFAHLKQLRNIFISNIWNMFKAMCLYIFLVAAKTTCELEDFPSFYEWCASPFFRWWVICLS